MLDPAGVSTLDHLFPQCERCPMATVYMKYCH